MQSSRQLRAVLLCIGLVSLIISMFLAIGYFVADNLKFKLLAFVYFLSAVALLSVYGAMTKMNNIGRHDYPN